MSIKHHPSEAAVLDYVAGALDEAWSLAIATHLALCPDCRRLAAKFEAMGGALIDEAPTTDVAPSDLDAVMARLDDDVEAPARPKEVCVLGGTFHDQIKHLSDGGVSLFRGRRSLTENNRSELVRSLREA